MNTKTDLALGREVELSVVLEGLRDELIKTQQNSQKKNIQFQVESVEVELQTVVKRNVNGSSKGKVGLWVFNAELGAGAAYEDAVTQKIKLTFSALDLGITDEKGSPQKARVSAHRSKE